MTRQDFILIAQALKDARPDNDSPHLPMWANCAGNISAALSTAAPRFDPEKFSEFCRSER